MTRTPRTLVPLTLAAAALLATPACSVSLSTPATATSPPSSVAVAPPEQVAMTAPPDADDVTLAEAAELIRPFLLTAEEVGPGFTAGDEPQPDPSTTAICGGPGTVAAFPDAVRVGAGFDGPVTGVLVQETVSVYADAATAREAYAYGVAGVTCGEGEVAGETVAIAPAEDLTVDVGGEQALGVVLGSASFDLIVVTVQSDAVVWNFTYLAAGDTLDELPDPIEVAAAGVAKFGDVS